jgi:maleylacetoacetate isomerase
MQPFQNLSTLKMVGEEKKSEWIQFYLHKGFRSLEVALKESSSRYCVGDEISIADLCLVPQVYSAKRFNVDLTDYPNVRRVSDALDKIPEFIKAHAHTQPDTIPELVNKF